MRRTSATDDRSMLELLCTPGAGGPGLEDRLTVLQDLRADAEQSRGTDRFLLEKIFALHQGLGSSRRDLEQLREVMARLTAEPWVPAVFLGAVPLPQGLRGWVRHTNGDRLVAAANGVDLAALQIGDTVLLNPELNVILARSPVDLDRCGETCSFERLAGDGQRLIVKQRDEEWVIRAPRRVLEASLRPGDLLRWNRGLMLASERLERSTGSQLFLEETPAETFAQVGGLGPQIEQIKRTLSLHLEHPELARKYQLHPKNSILLHGPAGTGKTLVAKALANWLGQTAPAGRALFMSIKPSGLHTMWYAQSEANYREAFRVAREAAANNPGTRVVMFFDEVDSVGGQRGMSHMRVHDNVLTAFLAELDGLASRGDVLVVGATNRREALDPALARPGRLGDLVLEVPRPNRQAARDIFGKHLPVDVPYARNGHGDDPAATRQELIEIAVSLIYAPNGENELATLTFRDGKRRTIRAADLVSGAVLANIARAAVESAAERERRTGESGLRGVDLADAIGGEFATAARGLTPANCRHHLSGLPYDLDVVNVEPVVRKVARPQRFLNFPE